MCVEGWIRIDVGTALREVELLMPELPATIKVRHVKVAPTERWVKVLAPKKRIGIRGVRDICGPTSVRDVGANGELETMPWESIMSNAAAHLASASSQIEQLAVHCGSPGGAVMSMELAAQSVWTAIVSLEECSFELWRSHRFVGCVGENSGHRVTIK